MEGLSRMHELVLHPGPFNLPRIARFPTGVNYKDDESNLSSPYHETSHRKVPPSWGLQKSNSRTMRKGLYPAEGG